MIQYYVVIHIVDLDTFFSLNQISDQTNKRAEISCKKINHKLITVKILNNNQYCSDSGRCYCTTPIAITAVWPRKLTAISAQTLHAQLIGRQTWIVADADDDEGRDCHSPHYLYTHSITGFRKANVPVLKYRLFTVSFQFQYLCQELVVQRISRPTENRPNNIENTKPLQLTIKKY